MGFTQRHLLGLEGVPAEEITTILDTAASFKEISERDIKKVPTLRGKTVVGLFYEASTRTRTSFEIAAKRLSADFVSIASSTSSSTKGETLLDLLTIRDKLGRLDDLTVAIVGDILHSRVTRSNVHALRALGARIRLV